MKLLSLLIQRCYFLLFFGLCSCTGCDIDRTEVSLSRTNPHPQLIDLSVGKCLVNEIEADISARQKGKLTNLMSKKLEEIFGDSVVYINTIPSSHFKEKIPFEISPEQLDSLRTTTSFTYLLSVRAINPDMASFHDQVNVDITIIDLDTRNTIYRQRVLASEYEPERENDSGFTFWLGHSEYNLIKNALQDGLRDLRRGIRKFNKTQGQE